MKSSLLSLLHRVTIFNELDANITDFITDDIIATITATIIAK